MNYALPKNCLSNICQISKNNYFCSPKLKIVQAVKEVARQLPA